MAEDDSHPFIDPSFFDLIVVGTGLPESIIAAAASSAGKSVIHLDPNSFYGNHFSSLVLDDFVSFLDSQRNIPSTPESSSPSDEGHSDYISVDLKSRCLYSEIEISSHGSKFLESSRKFSLDISGPRVLFCADSAVDLMLKSGASNHIEFKSIDASFVYGGDGKLLTVPDSRSAIFKDRSLGLTEKNQLMRFFKLVQEHFGSVEEGNQREETRRISDEDLESSFIDFLTKQRLPPKIKSIILYAISMADYDQDSPALCKNVVKTKDGIESLALYHSSVGRFTNALGALIYPIYGQGDLPQAFSRCAAVKGALYVLRMPVTTLLIDKESGHHKGVRLVSGQQLFSHQLVMSPSFLVPSPSILSPASNLRQDSYEGSSPRKVEGLVARGICIIRGSIKPDLSNLLVVFPPRSLYSEQVISVRALQLGSNLAVCPPGLFILYLSALCDDAILGKESLHSAMNVLTRPFSESHENSDSICGETVEEARPALLWSAMYVQELTEGSSETINLCPMPDGKLDYRNILESTTKMFHKIYPEEEFFPETKASENDDSSLDESKFSEIIA